MPLQLRLTGAPALLQAGAPEQALDRQAGLLAAVLALQGPQPRGQLAQLLWPEVAEPRARANLRQCLHRLKAAGGAAWWAGDAVLALAPGVHCLPPGDPDAGELLAGWSAPASGSLGAWLQQAREQARAEQLQALAARAQAAEAAQQFDEALAQVQRMLALDPLAEAHHRALMRLHYLRGATDQALAQHERLRRLLDQELGTPPDAQTAALLRLILQARHPPPGALALLPAALLRPPQLVGREAELQTLLGALRQRASVLLIGEAGIGKTRLIEALVQQQPRHAALAVSARPGDQAVPYALATRWLRALAAHAGPPPPARVRLTLAPLLPEWADATAPPAPEPSARRWGAAAQQLLDATIAQGLVALLLDDLHHADGASIELLQGLPGAGRCAWLLALRPGEGDPALLAWVQALQQASATQVLALATLDAPAVQRLVALVGAPPWAGEAQARALVRHTGGNPLFVLETLRALPDPGEAPAAWPAAPTVLRLIQGRLARLSAAARQVARCVAVLGPDATALRVARLLDQHPLALADAWVELEAAQVLRGEGFAHELMAQATHESLPEAIAQPLQAQVAALLAQDGGEPARVARHWLAAGQALQAAPWLARASAQAAGLGRLREAAQLAEQGARILQDQGQRRAAFDAWLRAADGYSDLLDLPAFDRCEQALLALADDAGQQAAAACATFFRLYQARQIDLALQVAQAALPKAQAAGLAEIEVELLWDLTALAWHAQDEALATAHAERALARLDAVDPATARLDPVTRRLQITEVLALLASDSGGLQEGRRRYRQGFDLALQLGRSRAALSAAVDLAGIALDFGDAQDSRHWHHCIQGLRAEVDADDAWAQLWALQAGLRLLPALGDLGQALAMSGQAAEFCAQDRSRYTVGLALACHYLQHDLGRADLARQGARRLATLTDLQPVEQAQLVGLQLALQMPVDAGPVLACCAQKNKLSLRAHLLCRAAPGLAPQAALPLLAQACAEAQAQGARGLHLMLQASRLTVLRAAGADPADLADPADSAESQALALWAELSQGLMAPVMYPGIAAQLCASLAPTQPELAQTIALRAGAWMLNAAATLPPAWRHNYLSRAPLLQALPPLQRGLLFGLAGTATAPAANPP